jgi:hypothetical protein
MEMRKSVLIMLLMLVSALSVAQAAEYYTKHKGDKREGEATADSGLVYVFRPAITGAAIKTWSFADDQLLGVTRAKGYSFALVPAGSRVIWSKAENTSAIELEVEGGRTYYFKTAIRPGLSKARVKLVQITEAEARKYLKKCSYCEPTEAGRARAAEIAANRVEKAVRKAAKR